MNYNKQALLISCFNGWFIKRLEPIKNYLESKGYSVKILLSDYDHSNKTYLLNFHSECKYVHVPSYKSNVSLKRIISHICFGKLVNIHLKSIKPDLIYLILPPNNTAVYCNRYKKSNPECKYIVDIIDLWPESLPLDWFKDSIPAKIWAKFRNDSLKIADHIFLECSLYKEKLKNIIPELEKKSSVLYLFKEQTELERKLVLKTIEEYEKERTQRNNKVILGYLGSINNIIDIEGICSVVRSLKMQNLAVEVRIIGDGQSRNSFIKALQSSGAEVNYYGKIFDQFKKIEILGKCDFGLNMMKDNISVGLTIKSIDYFSIGLPLINNIKGDTGLLIKKYGIGIDYNEFKKNKINYNYNKKKILSVFDRFFSKKSFFYNVENSIGKIISYNKE